MVQFRCAGSFSECSVRSRVAASRSRLLQSWVGELACPLVEPLDSLGLITLAHLDDTRDTFVQCFQCFHLRRGATSGLLTDPSTGWRLLKPIVTSETTTSSTDDLVSSPRHASDAYSVSQRCNQLPADYRNFDKFISSSIRPSHRAPPGAPLEKLLRALLAI
ncbi:hypothetical protein EVAR_23114_1 [Eumeta japonica]|uniref:Uncharacterized protein n=1 Tax=Eumeta variegata TaxID=151549 RepID=A0A4C1VL00_EUMVA|nr:hypothetical protein EVAR_23114_1 [Eumeta japonica]